MSGKPAARVGDPVARTMALSGALMGLAAGALIGIAIVATGGLGAIAIGGALAVTGGLGLSGQYIGSASMGPPTGMITTGSLNVFINSRPAARATLSLASCSKEYGIPQPEATGARTVLINGMPAGRKDEKIMCSAIIIDGSKDVIIGGPSVQTMAMNPEVPALLTTTMKVLAFGGALIATGGSIAAIGLQATLGYTALGFGGGLLGTKGGRWLGEQLGLGEAAKRSLEVLGGIAGGFAAVRSGQWFNRNYQIRINPNKLGMNGGNIEITPRPPPPFVKPKTGSWRNAPNPDKWINRGGSITQHRNGSVTYKNAAGQSIKYSADGVPNFKPHSVAETQLPNGFTSRGADFRAANNATGYSQHGSRSPPGHTWHHTNDGKTMQLIPRQLHRQFRHSGGFAKMLAGLFGF